MYFMAVIKGREGGGDECYFARPDPITLAFRYLLHLIYGIGFWQEPVMLFMYSKAARFFGISGNVRKRSRTMSSLLAATDMN